MSTMLANIRSHAVVRSPDGFLDSDDAKLDWTSVLLTIAGVIAILALARAVNLYFGGF